MSIKFNPQTPAIAGVLEVDRQQLAQAIIDSVARLGADESDPEQILRAVVDRLPFPTLTSAEAVGNA